MQLLDPDIQSAKALIIDANPTARSVLSSQLRDLGVQSSVVAAERANPKTDVWFGGTGDPHLQAAEQGLTEAYQSPALPKLHDWARRMAATADHKSVAVYLGPLGLAYNPEVLARKKIAPPRCWKDLVKPEYKGEIQNSNPNSSGTAYTAITTFVDLWGEEAAFAGASPVEAWVILFKGAFGDWFSWQNTLQRAAPLMLTALCVAIPARAGLVIIGGEGVMVLGGLALLSMLTTPLGLRSRVAPDASGGLSGGWGAGLRAALVRASSGLGGGGGRDACGGRARGGAAMTPAPLTILVCGSRDFHASERPHHPRMARPPPAGDRHHPRRGARRGQHRGGRRRRAGLRRAALRRRPRP